MKLSHVFAFAIVCAIVGGTIAAIWVGETTRRARDVQAARVEQIVDPPDNPPTASHEKSSAIDEPDETVADDSRHEALIAGVTIFALAIFVGFEVITKVPPTLHTPLMSGSNAISGITVVGAVIVAGAGADFFSSLLGLIAVALATVNVAGGFLVTHRMLAMFKKR